MKILHITLGNPKHHRGGLNRYCVDLMEQQENEGHSVVVLYAGSYGYWKKTKIKKVTEKEFAINGALPVAIIYGIDDPKRYMKRMSKDIYRDWLKEYRPDVIHVHSLMGIHEEFFCAAVQMKIPMIFTTHDYYPFCFRCNLFTCDRLLCDGNFDAVKCHKCNTGAGLNEKNQMLLQSEWYQIIKKLPLVDYLKKSKMDANNNADVRFRDSGNNIYSVDSFKELYEYYQRIMNMMTIIHCNSEIAKSFYQIHYPNLLYETIPISHKGIVYKKHIRKEYNKLHISYFGGMFVHKGYYQLKEVLAKLTEETNDEWDICMYGSEYTELFDDTRIKTKGVFSKKDEEEVWNSTDLLIFTSQWPETFGFGVLEALARGIPVICSDLVGAGYLFGELADACIYQHNDVGDLKRCIKRFLNPEYYSLIQKRIEQLELPLDMSEHAKNILQLYTRIKE